MLSVYTRHYPPCKQKNPAWRRCKCPKWIQGTTDSGEFIRRSARTRSWAKAQKAVHDLEDPQKPTTAGSAPDEKPRPAPETKRLDQARIALRDAVENFLGDARSRGLKPPSLAKLANLCRRQLLGWAERESLTYLDELTTASLTAFRTEWSDGPLARKKKHERLIGFLKFCVDCGWIQRNPAKAMRRVKADPVPTDYFPREEFDRIIEATDAYRDPQYEQGRTHSARLRAMALLMRWSGLRISDAVTLERSRLVDNNLLLYQAKTGTPVFVPLGWRAYQF